MLKITNHSENFDGAITVNDVDIATVNGAINDSIYANFSSYDKAAVKQNANTVSEDMAEFMNILLGVQSE